MAAIAHRNGPSSNCLIYVIHIVRRHEVRIRSGQGRSHRFKHGLRLDFGVEVFAADDHVILPSFRAADAEERYKAIGLVGGKLYTAVHTWRDDVVRMISVRRGNAG